MKLSIFSLLSSLPLFAIPSALPALVAYPTVMPLVFAQVGVPPVDLRICPLVPAPVGAYISVVGFEFAVDANVQLVPFTPSSLV